MEDQDLPFEITTDTEEVVGVKAVAWDDCCIDKSFMASSTNTTCPPFAPLTNSDELDNMSNEGVLSDDAGMDVDVVSSRPSSSIPVPSWSVTPGPALSSREADSNPLLIGEHARGYDEGYNLATSTSFFSTAVVGPDLQDPNTSKRQRKAPDT
jgi:hypothetical protein